jgi:putative transposase
MEDLSKGFGFHIGKMCQLMEASRSGYYKHLKYGKNSKRKQRSKVILRVILNIWMNARRVYGSPRITAALRKMGYVVNHKCVERLMREAGIRAIHRKMFKKTTNSKHNYQIVPNLILKKFRVEKLNQVWLSDITYIATKQGYLYLAVIMDLCSRMLVGYNMDNNLRTPLVMEALDKAVRKRGKSEELILHSDQGIQYASGQFKQQLRDYGITQSMSDLGNCYDNAPMESFFHSLKNELVYLVKFTTRKEAEQAIKSYIEEFYCSKRLHSSLNYKSPKEFEESLFVAM